MQAINVRVAKSFRNSYSLPFEISGIAAFFSGTIFFARCIRNDHSVTPAHRYLRALTIFLLAFFVPSVLPSAAFATCSAPKNHIEAENCLPGTPVSQWWVASVGNEGVGTPNIQGFTTDISVNVGQTIFFKVSTSASSYRIDIYRLGYYQGNDGRFIASISPSAHLPQVQPPCLTDNATGLIDGNWGISASWTVPSTAVSGVYFARLVRPDTGDVGAMVFIVRDGSAILTSCNRRPMLPGRRTTTSVGTVSTLETQSGELIKLVTTDPSMISGNSSPLNIRSSISSRRTGTMSRIPLTWIRNVMAL